ncbi:MAG: hypothetical protein JNL21_31465 [Myxococcales bacterium]|nr:hypothetical protein [Myxococcales bacterium]
MHAGVDRSVHGATVLEQDATTIRAKRTWDYVVEAGKTVGVFGSIGAYPPRPVPGFIVPGPFAPGSETYPEYVMPVQALNTKYTQVHAGTEGEDGLVAMVKTGLDLVELGLRPATVARVLAQLARERVAPHERWRRVVLQPLMNLDFFEKLYTRYRPHYATFHTNHAAHFMHHYWRAWDDSRFLTKSPPDEKRHYGEAVPYGYEIGDEIVARAMRFVDDDTVLVIATSMGQQPYVADLFPEGRIVVRFKDIRRTLSFLGIEGVTEIVPTMVPQYNLRIPDAAQRRRAFQRLDGAYVTGNVRPKAFFVEETGEILTVTPGGLDRPNADLRYFFPDAPEAKPSGHLLEEHFVCDTPTPKQGMHHPTGVLCLWGPGIAKSREITRSTNLDILPTTLRLLGVPVPAHLPGRVLEEAWAAGSERLRPKPTEPVAA